MLITDISLIEGLTKKNQKINKNDRKLFAKQHQPHTEYIEKWTEMARKDKKQNG